MNQNDWPDEWYDDPETGLQRENTDDDESSWDGEEGFATGGWQDDPDEFDYDLFVEDEFGNRKFRSRLHPVYVIAAVIMLLLFLFGIVLGIEVL